MRHRFFRAAALFLVLILLTSCSIPMRNDTETDFPGQKNPSRESSMPDPSDTAAEAKAIQVAGLSLMTNTLYKVYLEPAEACFPAFSPVYASIEFDSANYCHLTYKDKTVDLGRFTNDKYIGLFSTSEEQSEQLVIDGKCDTNCSGADFAIRVSSFIQGQDAIHLFGDQAFVPSVPEAPELPQPRVMQLGQHRITLGERYVFRIIADENCDKTFDPFSIPIAFHSELGAYFVTYQYKNVSSVYPASFTKEDNGWIEFSSGSGSFWGILDAGTEGSDFSFRVYGLNKNPAQLFKNISVKQIPVEPPVPEEPEPVQPADYDTNLYYYYGLLSQTEKVVYTQLTDAYRACETNVKLACPVSNEALYCIRDYIRFDQPDLFWTDSMISMKYQNGLVTEVILHYNSLAENLTENQKKVEAAVQKILSGTKGMRPQDQERFVHDYLVSEIVYQSNANDQNIYSAFVDKQTVCAGYSRAFQYVMQRLGIPCYYCRGYAGNADKQENHAWNVIRMNGGWYNVDLTWDDKYQEGWCIDFISYEYFNVTDDFLSLEHARRDVGLLLPACQDTAASFDNLYEHSWKEEIAISGAYSIIDNIDVFYRVCYEALMKTGVGNTVTGFVITDKEVLTRIFNFGTTREHENGYVYPFFKDSGLGGNIYYKPIFDKNGALSSRGTCYFLEITHIVEKK